MKRQKRSESGQAAVLLALAFVGLIAFAALAIDGGNAYLMRRNAQNAADAAVINGARELHKLKNPQEGDTPPEDPDAWLRVMINDAAQRNSVPDTTDDVDNLINDNIEAYYLGSDGNRLGSLQIGASGAIPANAQGVEAIVDIPFDTFLAGLVGQPHMVATVGAGAVFTGREGSIRAAIWADGDCTPQTLNLTGSYQEIIGGMHSNACLQINGNMSEPSYYSGTVEYVRDDCGGVQGAVFDSPPDNQPITTSLSHLPPLFYIDDYDSTKGGIRASEAMSESMYYYYPDNGTGNAPDFNGLPGLHFSADADGIGIGHHYGTKPISVTFVTAGLVDVKADTLLVPYEDEILIFTTKGGRGCPSNVTAIKMAGSQFNWQGLVYAPNGHITMSASDNSSLYGSIVGWTIDLSGSQIEIRYDPRFDPPIPPKVILVW